MNNLHLLTETVNRHWYKFMLKHFTYLHQYPELSFQETQTIQYLTEVLKSMELDPILIPVQGKYGSEIVNSHAIAVSFGQGDRTAVFTGDFDGLSITEESSHWYRSKNEGRMHACGHDMHTSILLGLAWWLKQHEHQLNCRVLLLFRPAEEVNGAAFLVPSEKVRNLIGENAVCFALHTFPNFPVGQIGTRAGTINYSAEFLSIQIKGKGGHTARPQHSFSPLTAMGKILVHLPEMIREKCPEAILAFGQAHGGTKGNVIPEEVVCEATLRTPNAHLHEQAKVVVEEYLKSQENEYIRINLQKNVIPYLPAVINDEQLVAEAQTINQFLPWIEVKEIETSQGGDDVSWFNYLGYPTHYACLGVNPPKQEKFYDLHLPKFYASPRALLTGAQFQVFQLLRFMAAQ